MRWWLLLGVAGCWDPTETGPKGMVGVLVGADGAPVADQLMESLEAQKRTGPDGTFALQFKPPNTGVTFRRGGAFYQRALLPADAGVDVTLKLPALREANLACGERTCDATLRWTLAEGFTASVIVPCKAGATLDIGEVPVGTPEVTCRAGLGAPLEAISVEDRGTMLVVTPPPRLIRVVVAGPAPDTCAVALDGVPATKTPDGWTGESTGIFVATATCGGIPARPVLGDIREPSAELVWTANPPTFDPAPVFQPVGEVVLVADAGWKLAIVARPDGTFALPPLEAGRYRLIFAAPDARDAAFAVAPPPPVVGELVVAEPAEGVFVGVLELAEPLATGKIPVRR